MHNYLNVSSTIILPFPIPTPSGSSAQYLPKEIQFSNSVGFKGFGAI